MRILARFLLVSSALIIGSFADAHDLTRQRSQFLKAEKAIARGNYKQLDKLLTGLESYPLYPYLIYKKLSKRPEAIKDIETFSAEYHDTRYPRLLRRKLLKFLASKKRWSQYISHYKRTVSPELQCFYYWALYRTGQKSEALEGAHKLWMVGRSQPKACDPLFDRLLDSKSVSREMVWQRFGLSMDKRSIKLANYLKHFIPRDERKVANFWLKVSRNPRIVSESSDWDASIPQMSHIFVNAIDRLTRRDPGLALSIWKLQKKRFTVAKKRGRETEHRLGIALAVNRDPGAAEFLANIDLEAADTPLLEWRVREALLRQDWESVLLYLDQLIETERLKPRWQYWRARATEGSGKDAEAKKLFRDVAQDRSFYGFLAADRLALDYAWSDRPLEVSQSEINQVAAKRNFRAAFEFRFLDRPYLARSEWWSGVRHLNLREILIAAKLAEKWNWDQIAIFTIAKAKYWDDLELRFPISYKKFIVRNAGREQLDPSFVYGVIRQESAFDRFAHSRAGARGLMQIMPATGRQIARRLKKRWTSNRILYEPEVNLRFGTSYLKKLLNQFDRSFVLATAAYNAGQNRVDRWLPKDETIPADIWIENIPFKETRDYVSTVLAYTVIYHKRLNGKLLRVSNFLGKIAPA